MPSKIAAKQHHPGDVWKTPNGNWRGMGPEGEAQSFNRKDEAETYAKGGSKALKEQQGKEEAGKKDRERAIKEKRPGTVWETDASKYRSWGKDWVAIDQDGIVKEGLGQEEAEEWGQHKKPKLKKKEGPVKVTDKSLTLTLDGKSRRVSLKYGDGLMRVMGDDPDDYLDRDKIKAARGKVEKAIQAAESTAKDREKNRGLPAGHDDAWIHDLGTDRAIQKSVVDALPSFSGVTTSPRQLRLVLRDLETLEDALPKKGKKASLRSQIIRLASSNPKIRPLLLPLLK